MGEEQEKLLSGKTDKTDDATDIMATKGVNKADYIEVSDNENNEIDKDKNQFKKLLNVLLCTIGVVFYCASFVGVQYLGGAVPENELNAFRFGVSTIAALPFIAKEGLKSLLIPKSKLWLLTIISVLSICYNYGLYRATVFIPVGSTASLCTAATLITEMFISLIWKRTMTKLVAFSSVIAILGSFCITQPQEIFSTVFEAPRHVNWTSPCLQERLMMAPSLNSTSHDDTPSLISHTYYGYMLSLAGGAFLHINNYAIKAMPDEYVNSVLFWKPLSSTVISVIIMVPLENLSFPTGIFCLSNLFLHCLGVTIYSCSVIISLKVLTPGVINFITSLHLFVLVILQYTLMKNIVPGKENWLEALGSALCFIGCISGIICDVFNEIKGNKQQV